MCQIRARGDAASCQITLTTGRCDSLLRGLRGGPRPADWEPSQMLSGSEATSTSATQLGPREPPKTLAQRGEYD